MWVEIAFEADRDQVERSSISQCPIEGFKLKHYLRQKQIDVYKANKILIISSSVQIEAIKR